MAEPGVNLASGYGPRPGGYGVPPGHHGPGRGDGGPSGTPPGTPSPLVPGEALLWAFRLFTSDVQGVALPIVVGLAALLVSVWGAVAVLGLVVGLVAAPEASPTMVDTIQQVARGGGGLVGLFAGSYLTAGLYPFLLNVARGRAVQMADVFHGGPLFVKVLGVNLLTALLVSVGNLLCLVPGIILGLGLSLSLPLAVDRDLGIVDTLKESWRLTEGHKMTLFVFSLLATGVVLLGVIACCLGAVLVAHPVVLLAHAYVYLKLTGEEPIEVTPS